jgi:hypothetical protein
VKSLEEEAEEYFDINIFCDGITPFEEDISKRCFVAGANSKYVGIQKIVFALGHLYKYREATFGKGKNLIEELVEQLRKLEDETQSRLL